MLVVKFSGRRWLPLALGEDNDQIQKCPGDKTYCPSRIHIISGIDMSFFGIVFSREQMFLFAGACGLAMLLIGAYTRNAINRRQKAAAEFRSAFDGVILNLRENPECPIAQFTYTLHNGHLAAITRYRDHVPFWKKRSFDRAVKDYKEAHNMAQDWGNKFAIVYSENTPIAREKREIYGKIIHKLLSFA